MTSPALDAGLADLFHSEVWALKCVWPTGTMRLMTSPGEISFNSETFVGGDDTTWGVILDAEAVGEGLEAVAPTCRVTMALTPMLQAAIRHPNAQLSRVDIWRGLRSLTSAALIDLEPLVINGRFSTASEKWGAETAEILFVSHSERRFLPSGGVNYDTNFDARIDATDLFNQYAAGTAAVSGVNSIPTNTGTGGGGSASGGFIGRLVNEVNSQFFGNT